MGNPKIKKRKIPIGRRLTVEVVIVTYGMAYKKRARGENKKKKLKNLLFCSRTKTYTAMVLDERDDTENIKVAVARSRDVDRARSYDPVSRSPQERRRWPGTSRKTRNKNYTTKTQNTKPFRHLFA